MQSWPGLSRLLVYGRTESVEEVIPAVAKLVRASSEPAFLEYSPKSDRVVKRSVGVVVEISPFIAGCRSLPGVIG